MTARWSVSDVKECQVDIWRPFKDGFGIIDGCFCLAITARPVGRGRDEVEGLGKLLVFMRHELWAIVCKTAKRDAVACEVGFSEVDDSGL